MDARDEDLTTTALHLSALAGDLGAFCDHAEHNEGTEVATVLRIGGRVRSLAEFYAAESQLSLAECYARRLEVIESRNVLCEGETLESQALEARSWRDLQLIQAKHDRLYHPDVMGLSKHEQLRHYAFHLAKLAGLAARAVLAGDPLSCDVAERMAADLTIFGVKLATVVNDTLSRHDAL
jgi:hypothetical protein